MTYKNIRMARAVSQIIFFLLLAVILVGTYCSVSLGSGAYLTCSLGILQLTLSSQQIVWGTILSGLLLLALTVVLGRVFCGWICPFGAVLDWLQKPISRFTLTKKKLPPFFAGSDARGIKYGILGGVLLAAGIVKYPAFCTVCPVGTICRTAGLQGVNIGAETAVLPIIASMETVRRRFWCRSFCPIGALLALVSKFSIVKIRLPLTSCTGCNRCEQACAMENSPRYEGSAKLKRDPEVLKALIENGMPDALDRPEKHAALPSEVHQLLDRKNSKITVNPLECTRCFACVSVCPALGNREKRQPALHQDGRQTAV